MTPTKKRPAPFPIESEEEDLYPSRPHTPREEDGFNEQPASGGVIGGTRGAQEYGIEGEIAEEEEHQRAEAVSIDREGCGGLSQFSAGGVEALIAKSEASEDLISDVLPESGKELESLLNERLRTHPALSSAHISVRITPAQEILLSGEVHSEAERLLAVEITEAIAPALAVVTDLHLPVQRRW